MQAVMNIMVTVNGARRAQAELAGVTAATRGVRGASGGAAAASLGFGNRIHSLTKGLEKYGKNMQWVGRQIEYNFTLPIAIATTFATKWALENERAMVRLKKVYGDNSMPTKQYTEETEALGRAFRFLSDNFGVALDEVIDSGATFAQAGAGNIAVANGVRAALELQILGEMELAEATEALIAIQAQYNLSSQDLTQVIADLNAVENTTTVTLNDQIVAMQRSAGVAREAGVSHRELSGMIASMVPAAGNARQAGNSLKTTITRIMAPTRQAKDAMEGLGIATEGTAWRNMNATQRFMELAEALDGVATEQRTVALTHIAGRRQVSRLAVLLRDMTREQGRYATALRVTEDPADSMLRKQREIETFLRSGPQGFKILTTQLKNYAAEIGAQLIPTLLAVLNQVRDLARWFAELDPNIRNTAVSLLLLVAVVGPIVRYMGSTVLLLTQFLKFFVSLPMFVFGAVSSLWSFVGALKTMAKGALVTAGSSLATLGDVIWRFGKVVWTSLVRGASVAVFTFANIVYTAVANMGIAFLHLITTYVAPAALAFLNHMRMIAFSAGTSLLGAVIPALASSARAFGAWAAAAIISFTRATIVGAALFAVTLPAWIRSSVAALSTFVTQAASLLLGIFVPVMSAATGAIWRFGGAALWRLLTVPGAITIAMLNFAQVMRPIAVAIFAPFTAATSAFIASLGRGLIPALGAAVAAVGSWAVSTVGSILLAAQTWALTYIPMLGTMARATIFQLGLAWQAAARWAGSVVASTALAARAFLVHIGTSIMGVLSTLVAALGAAGWAALLWARRMVVAAFVASGAWIAGLVPKLIAAIKLIPTALGLAWIAVKGFLVKAAAAIITFISGPIGLIVAAVAGLAWVFRDQLGQAFEWLVSNADVIPETMRNAMQATVDVVSSAVSAVLRMFQRMLNPFGSGGGPSVPNVPSPPPIEPRAAGGPVKKGQQYLVGEQGPELFTASQNGNIIPAGTTAAMKSGEAAMSSFKSATGGARASIEAAELAELRDEVTAAAPGAGDEFDMLVRAIKEMEGALERVNVAVEVQERVVSTWESKLDAANATLDAANDRLEELRDRASEAADALSDAESQLDAIANTPIEGMRAMEDAIWSNEMAQKSLRLEMLKLEQVHGPIDDLQSRLAKLSGDIETLRGERGDLRMAGAGSDVLGMFDAQIAAMEAERRGLMSGGGGPADEMANIQDELDSLQLEGQILDLERSLQFDPLTRQIERMVDNYNELPFDEIVSSVEAQKRVVADLRNEYQQAEKAVRDQEKAVEEATKARDQIETRYNLEVEALERLEEVQRDLTDALREMNQELEGFAQLAASAAAAASGAGGAGGAGAGGGIPDEWGDYEIPGGDVGLGWEAGDIDALLAEWGDEDMFADVFGSFDLFEPLREKWEQFRGWIEEKWNQFTAWFGTLSVDGEGIFSRIREGWESFLDVFRDDGMLAGLWSGITSAVTSVWESLQTVVSYLEGPLRDTWDAVSGFVLSVVDVIREHWNAFWDSVGGGSLQTALDNIGSIIAVAGEVISGIFRAIGIVFASIWEGILPIVRPIFDMLVGIIDGVFGFIRGIVQTFIALFAGDWQGLWDGIVVTVQGIVTAIAAVLVGLWDVIWGIFEGIWTFLVGIWNRIYEWLVGGSIIPDLVNAIIGWFQWLWEKAVEIWNFIKNAITVPIAAMWEWMQAIWTTITTWIGEKWNALKEKASIIWNGIKALVQLAVTALRDKVYEVIEAVRLWLAGKWDAIKSKVETAWNAIGAVWDSIKTWVDEKIKDPINGLKESLAGIWDSIKETTQTKWDAIKGAVVGAVNGIIGAINGVIRAWNGLEFSLPGKTFSAFGETVTIGGMTIGTPNVPTIPLLAKGGLITQPTLAMMGETAASRPEIVSPERLMRRIIREEVKGNDTSGDKNINFYGDLSFPNITDGDDAEKFIRNLESMS